jgi:hypothetical protein
MNSFSTSQEHRRYMAQVELAEREGRDPPPNPFIRSRCDATFLLAPYGRGLTMQQCVIALRKHCVKCSGAFMKRKAAMSAMLAHINDPAARQADLSGGGMSEAALIARALKGRKEGDGWLCHCPFASHGKGRGESQTESPRARKGSKLRFFPRTGRFQPAKPLSLARC